MDYLIMALQLLLSLSILVVTHELGHFLFAKLFKIKVEKFFLFFDAGFKLFSFKKGETEYGVGWLPLGGYVKIAGMIDESMDTDQMSQPVQEWEFRAKPAWQRALVMAGGIMVNLITAPLIFWIMAYSYGETYLPLSEGRNGFDFSDVMQGAGFRNGDIVIGVNGRVCETYKEAANAIIFEDTCTVDIVRRGEAMSIKLPHDFFRDILSGDDSQALFAFRVPTVVDSVMAGSPAEACGMAKGDSVISAGYVSTPSFYEFAMVMDSLKGREVSIVVARVGGGVDTLDVNVGEDGKVGIYNCPPTRWLTPKTIEYSLWEALPAGVMKGKDLLVNYCKQLPMLFTKEGATKVGGFGTIAKMFPSRWNWQAFWFNTAFLAIILAVMNLLPIPGLDGGHLLFVIIEMITGYKASDRVLEVAQTIGMGLILLLVVYANGADIVRFIIGK
ncbi:MAG: RIP metalloprotease RseP [Marinilabiliaceae bacterium]